MTFRRLSDFILSPVPAWHSLGQPSYHNAITANMVKINTSYVVYNVQIQHGRPELDGPRRKLIKGQ